MLKTVKNFFTPKPKVAYTGGKEYKTKVVVGLGNPGEKYENTRHNIGFMAIDRYMMSKSWIKTDDYHYLTTKDAYYVKPMICINQTGETLISFLKSKNLEPQMCKILILVDEILLPLGQVRDKKETAPSRHNGVRDLIKHIGDDFDRIRIGIGEKPKETTTINYVLEEFSPQDAEKLEQACIEACMQIRKWKDG